jgi:hypothetical protein
MQIKTGPLEQCIQEIRNCRRCAGSETGQRKVAARPSLRVFPKKDDVPFRFDFRKRVKRAVRRTILPVIVLFDSRDVIAEAQATFLNQIS